jgi:hypothetical protein
MIPTKIVQIFKSILKASLKKNYSKRLRKSCPTNNIGKKNKIFKLQIFVIANIC